jgi:hypothetical protein
MARSVVDTLSPRDRQLAAWFKKQGFERPYLTVAALRKADIKPQTAAALLAKESGGGNNIFGCDWGPRATAPWCNQPVTLTRYKALRRSGKPNGVGPTQLTSFGFCDEADRLGGCHLPYPNMLVGFGLVGRLIREHGIRNGANRYNGGDSLEGQRNGEAAGYGKDFAARRAMYAARLRNAGFKV